MRKAQREAYKARLFGQFAQIGRALAGARRLELLELLAQGERGVEELARASGMSVANTSQHLQVLRQARLVEARKEGLHVRYRLADEKVFALWQALRDLGRERLAELDRLAAEFFQERHEFEPVTMAELRRRLKEERVVVLDVRPEEEYAAGHIAGAVSLPVEEVPRRLPEVPRGPEVVAYCRGPWCLLADQAVHALRGAGIPARRLEAGFPDWKAKRYPVEAEAGAGRPGKE